MYYYTYMTTLRDSDKYYVGRHQSKKHPDNDRYVGSGKWVKSIKDKSRLERTILAFHDSEINLIEAEAMLIKNHFRKPNCMNMNEHPVGFGSEYNPSKLEERREANRIRLLEHNPMKGKTHRPDTIELMRKASTGKQPSKETRQKISDSAKGRYLGKEWTDEQKRNLAERRKEEYATGTRVHAKGFKGKEHSEEMLALMREKASNRPKIICPHCNAEVAACAFARWHGDNCTR